MCNSLHPQLSPILICYILYYISLLSIHSSPNIAFHISPIAPPFFICLPLLLLLHLTMWHEAAWQLSTYVNLERTHERAHTYTSRQTFMQTHTDIIYVLKEMNCRLAMHVVVIGKKFLPVRAWNMDCGHICAFDRVEIHRPWLLSPPKMLDSSHCNHHIGRVQFRNQEDSRESVNIINILNNNNNNKNALIFDTYTSSHSQCSHSSVSLMSALRFEVSLPG